MLLCNLAQYILEQLVRDSSTHHSSPKRARTCQEGCDAVLQAQIPHLDSSHNHPPSWPLVHAVQSAPRRSVPYSSKPLRASQYSRRQERRKRAEAQCLQSRTLLISASLSCFQNFHGHLHPCAPEVSRAARRYAAAV